MFNFKEWLKLQEMAMGDIVRNPVPMDESDARYLRQFSLHEWPAKLADRYNKYLEDSVEDYQSGSYETGKLAGEGKVKIKTRASDDTRGIIHKLENLGYDLRNTEPGTGQLAGLRLMTLHNARRLVYDWVTKTGFKRDVRAKGGRPKSGVKERGPTLRQLVQVLPVYWEPNKRIRGAKSYYEQDPRNYVAGTGVREQERERLVPQAKELLDKWLQKTNREVIFQKPFMEKPENKIKITTAIVDNWMQNLREPFYDEAWKYKKAWTLLREITRKNWGGGGISAWRVAKEYGVPVDMNDSRYREIISRKVGRGTGDFSFV